MSFLISFFFTFYYFYWKFLKLVEKFFLYCYDINMKKFDKEKLINLIIVLIMLVGMSIRLVNIGGMPNALNCDEASEGYEAYSIWKYGIDRNGNHLPVFLKSWGSGQNILLAWMMIPFIAMLGLNTIAIRLPMAILSCVTLVLFYFLLKKITNKKVAIIGLAFLAICPWNIEKSRWALESNVFPDIILIATYLLVVGLNDKNKFCYWISFIVYGLSVYAYGTSYMFLPLFLIALLITLVIKKEIRWKKALGSLIVSTIVALPIILYVAIGVFDLPQINLPFMTIPKLTVNRYNEITSNSSNNFVKTCFFNFCGALKVLLFGNDGLDFNSIKPYGLFYPFSILFTFIGAWRFLKEDSDIKYNYIFNIWLIVSLLLFFFVEPNINRINIIMFPMIIYTSIGIAFICEKSKTIVIILSITYAIFFILFVRAYFKQNYKNYFTFDIGLKEVIEYADSKDENVVITNRLKEPYIYVLFYTKYDSRDFVNTVKVKDENVEYRQVESFGKYSFENLNGINDFKKNTIYVIKKEQYEDLKSKECNLNDNNIKITDFGKLVSIEVK